MKQPFADAFQNMCSEKFRNIHGKVSLLESLFNKVAELRACNFIKIWLQHRCFSVIIAKFLRTVFLQNTSSGCFYRCSTKKLFRKILRTLLEYIIIGVLFNQVAGLKLETLSKEKVRYRCFAVNFERFLRTILCRTTAAPGC